MGTRAHEEADASMHRERLRHVYWIGGGSGAGKSTITRRLADRFGWHVYATDDVMPDHASRIPPGKAPYLDAFASMDIDERWVERSTETMLDTFHWFRGEGFDLIVDDLSRLPMDTGVVAEGFRLLPHLVAPLLARHGRAVWLLPTPQFREVAFTSRGPVWDIPGKTSNPERARRNLLERDRMFTDRLDEEARSLGMPTITVDTGIGEDELTDRVARAFGL